MKPAYMSAAVAAACFSCVASAQLTNSTTFPSSGEEASRLQDYPSITHRYGNDNLYSRWRATGVWDVPQFSDMQIGPSAVVPSSGKSEAGRAVKQDGYGAPIKR